jgi:hypothetical protein
VRSFGSAFVATGEAGYGGAAAGDHLQTVYRFWLLGHQLERGGAPWRDPYSFQPLVEEQIALGNWPFGIPFWPLEAAFGPVIAWNVLLLAGIVAAGLATYGWLRALGLQAPAAALGGLAFAVAPYRIEQSAGHLLGWVAILLPLCLLAVERGRAAEGRRAQLWGAAGALALVSVPLSGQVHLALGAIPLVLAYAAARFSRAGFAWALGGAVAAVGVGFWIRYTVIAGSIEAGGRSLGEVRQFQADWTDLATRGVPRPGDVFAAERFVYVGWLTGILAIAGLVLLLRGRRLALAAVLGLAAVVPLLLAMGTNMPGYAALWDALPPFRFPRVPERLVPVSNLAVAGLTAAACARILRAVPARRAAAATCALVVVLGADLVVQPLRASAADEGNRAYEALPPGGRVFQIPVFEPGIHFGSVYLYHALTEAREQPQGYSTLAPQPAFDLFFRLNRLNCGVWLDGDLAELRSLGVGSVILHAGLFEQARLRSAWFAWRALQAHGFRPVASDGAVTLFRPAGGVAAEPPVPEPPGGEVVFCEGWRRFTMSERQAPLWVHGPGRLGLQVTAPGATAVTVWRDGEVLRRVSVERAATIEVDLPGDRWHWVMLEIPVLLPGNPPQAVTVERLTLAQLP